YCGYLLEPGKLRTSAMTSMRDPASRSRNSSIGRVEGPIVQIVAGDAKCADGDIDDAILCSAVSLSIAIWSVLSLGERRGESGAPRCNAQRKLVLDSSGFGLFYRRRILLAPPFAFPPPLRWQCQSDAACAHTPPWCSAKGTTDCGRRTTRAYCPLRVRTRRAGWPPSKTKTSTGDRPCEELWRSLCLARCSSARPRSRPMLWLGPGSSMLRSRSSAGRNRRARRACTQ